MFCLVSQSKDIFFIMPVYVCHIHWKDLQDVNLNLGPVSLQPIAELYIHIGN